MSLLKKNGGFTLVELIVVIAILAILAGVAVPAYSGYVEKANKQADITLARDIKQALTLAHYNGTLASGASVVVSTSNVSVSGDGASQAMVDVFGADYADTVRLKHDDWSGEMGPAADAGMMEAVDKSNFTTDGDNLDSLLGQVQTVVNAAQGAMTGMKPDEGSVLADSLNKAGITLDADGKIRAEDAGAAANALVFSVAGDITKANFDQSTFAANWADYVGNPDATGFVYEMDNVSKAAIEYAAVLSLAKHIDKKNEGVAGYTSFASKLENFAGEGKSILENKNAVRAEMLTYMEKNPTVAEDYDFTSDSQAFLAYMNGVTQSSDSLLENENLYKDNYFSDGTVSSYVKDYVSMGEVLAGTSAPNGAFVILYNGAEVRCMPLDY